MVVSAPGERCFTAFCDTKRLPEWMPELRAVKVLRARPDGLPLAALFDYGDAAPHTVTYDYPAVRRVAWSIDREGASWADFAPRGDDCYVRCFVDGAHARHRDEAARVVAAFTRFVLREHAGH
jgi:hypothetical protein